MLNSDFKENFHSLLSRLNYTLSTAESLTGGRIGAEIVSNPGSSKYYKGSLTAYADHIKEDVLGVHRESLLSEGAVSCLVAKEMALGAQKLFKKDIALSTTGIAGPSGATAEKKVGYVCFGLVFQERIITWTRQFEGNRMEIIDLSVQEALKKLYEFLGDQ